MNDTVIFMQTDVFDEHINEVIGTFFRKSCIYNLLKSKRSVITIRYIIVLNFLHAKGKW